MKTKNILVAIVAVLVSTSCTVNTVSHPPQPRKVVVVERDYTGAVITGVAAGIIGGAILAGGHHHHHHCWW